MHLFIQSAFINLYPNEYSQEFHYYQFTDKFGKCVGCYNSLNDLSNKAYVPNKTEDLNLSVFNTITGINESKTLTKHISCEGYYEGHYEGCLTFKYIFQLRYQEQMHFHHQLS